MRLLFHHFLELELVTQLLEKQTTFASFNWIAALSKKHLNKQKFIYERRLFVPKF